MMNYTTKVEDPVYKRTATTAELFYILRMVPVREDQAEGMYQTSIDDNRRSNKTRQFLIKVANRVFIN